MKTLLLGLAALVLLVGALVLGHLALIEIGRDVVTLRTQSSDGTYRETRLWIVEDDRGGAWLHSAGQDWVRRFEVDPVVEILRGDQVQRFRATPVPGPHPEIDALLREKYGVADVWVRFLAPCDASTVPVRLDPV